MPYTEVYGVRLFDPTCFCFLLPLSYPLLFQEILFRPGPENPKECPLAKTQSTILPSHTKDTLVAFFADRFFFTCCFEKNLFSFPSDTTRKAAFTTCANYMLVKLLLLPVTNYY